MEEEISLSEIFAILKRHFSKIIIWGLLGLIVFAVYTFFFVTPLFESTSKIVVNQTQNTGQAITNTDIQTNLNLINTYQSIIKEPIILEDAIKNTNSKLTVSDLKNNITVQTEDSSLVFGITVSDENPYDAAELSNAVSSSFESKIGEIIEVESVTILSQATPNLSAVSPNIIINITMGLILGVFLGVFQAILTEIFNKTVKDETFLESLGWVNLGSVLEMTSDEIKNTRINTNQKISQLQSRNSRRRV